MAGKLKHRSATMAVATIATIVLRMVAPCWMVPALLINVDWSQGWYSPWNLAAAGSIIASALFIEAAWHARSVALTPTFLVAAFFLMLCNTQVAFEHASGKSDHRSDDRRHAMKMVANASSQRSQAVNGRTEAATVAGELSPGKYEADIQQLIANDSSRWQATGNCDPALITAGQSKSFCAAIAALRARVDAARRRDALDAKIAALDAKGEDMDAPTVADPYAENMAAFLGLFGMRFTDAEKRVLSASRDLFRSIGLEIIAALGPTGWLLMVNAFTGALSTGAAQNAGNSRNKPNSPDKSTEAPTGGALLSVPPVAMNDPFHAFVAARLEDATGARTPAGDPWAAWLVYCADNKIDAGSQKAFGLKMKARFAWEPNNNRPRYLNVKLKPSLRLVHGQAGAPVSSGAAAA